MQSTSDVLARIDAGQEGFLEELKEYLRFPSISTDPQYAPDVTRCADWLCGRMKRSGLDAAVIATDGHPLVYGEWTGAKERPTVLFYGHYDVQPPDPLELWRHPPFEPTVEGDHLVARGATDDKGQSFAHLLGVAATLEQRGELPLNVKFLIEGEEESGGEAIEKFVREDRGRKLASDCVVISDSSMFGPSQPSLLYGLKGLLYLELRAIGPNRDLHSGTFGGAVTNPLNALATVLGRLRDPVSGRVLVPGFYDRVRPLEEWERSEFAALPFDAEAYARELGVDELCGEEGYTTLERTWVRPTLDLNGIWGGYQGQGAKTVLPAEGGAKVSMRLVPDQEPLVIARAVEDFVSAITPAGVRIEVETLSSAPPVLIDTDGPYAEAALDAMEQVWGNRPVKVREGGSIPIVSTFSKVLEVPVLLLGFGLSDDRLHSPNEKFNVSHFYNGIRSTACLLDQLSAVAG